MSHDGPHPLSLFLYVSALFVPMVSLLCWLPWNSRLGPPTHREQELMQWAEEVALRSEHGMRKEMLTLWDHPPVFALVDGDPQYRDAITQTMQVINQALRGTRLGGIHLTAGLGEAAADAAKANVKIYCLSSAAMKERAKSLGMEFIEAHAVVSLRWTQRLVLSEGKIWFNTDHLTDQRYRLSTILEEMTQALGFLGDSWVYPDSIFYQGETPGQWPTTLSPQDKALIRLCYQHLRPGMTRTSVLPQVRDLIPAP